MSKGLPTRQGLVGLWLLLGGVSLLGGAAFAAWLDSQLALNGIARVVLWLGSLSGGVTLLAVGWLLERALVRPLRALHGELARLIANPEVACQPPGGWLESLRPDLIHIARCWRADRQRYQQARREGAQETLRVRQELEELLQHLATPIMLFDQHRRLLLFNQAAEAFFPSPHSLGLGKRLDSLVPDPSLSARFKTLVDAPVPREPFSREVLTRFNARTLSISLTRLSRNPDQVLMTLKDATRFWENELGIRKRITKALETLESPPEPASISSLKQLLKHPDLAHERLSSIWSNAFWQALDEQLAPTHQLITPIGVPGWFKGHAPSLIALFDSLIKKLHGHFPQCGFEGELVNTREGVWLAFIWKGDAVDAPRLARWRQKVIETLPLAPTVDDLLHIHGSTLWSEADADNMHARLCVSLLTSQRLSAPEPRAAPRPEFHDFAIAHLTPPDEPLAERMLRHLAIVAFDTETTGLDLRGNDRVISLGACRIVNNRLLASDVFESYINPQRGIPAQSTAIHGIYDSDVQDAPLLDSVLRQFQTYTADAVLLAHNASFDLLALSPAGIKLAHPVLDTLLISRALDKALLGHDLDTLAKRYDLAPAFGARHTALGDAQLTAELWLLLLSRLEARNIHTLDELLAFQASAFDKEDGHT
ncbi:exonuclease domain-containing protein [Vreelandella sp. EE22]